MSKRTKPKMARSWSRTWGYMDVPDGKDWGPHDTCYRWWRVVK